MPSNNDRDFAGVDKKYLNNIIHKSYDISFDNELIKNLYNIAKSENNNTACIELSNINTADIGKIFSYSELRYIMNSFFVYKAQNNDIYIYIIITIVMPMILQILSYC